MTNIRGIATYLTILVFFVVDPEAQVYGSWSKYREITINTTSENGGANVAETVTDFPVLVRLSSEAASTGANALSEALPDGADLRFSNAAGDAALDYEIERWTESAADVWVKVPSVAGDDNTVIRMYWGNSGAESESDGAAVFDTANGFGAVWHMNGAGEGGEVDETDATGGGLTATQYSNTGTEAASSDQGGVGYFRVLSASGNEEGQGFTTDDPDRVNFLNTDSYKISTWINPASIEHNPYPTIVTKHDNQWSLRVNSGQTGPWLFFYGNDGGWPGVESEELAVLGQWQHVVGVRSVEDNTLRVYVNGVLSGTTEDPDSGGDQPTNTSVAIGRRSEAADRFWNGAIGEVRVESAIRSPEWIALEYETQKPGATALTFGATQSVQPRPLFYPLKHATYLHNVTIEENVPVVDGTPTGFSINPSTLPDGLNFNTETGVIAGEPTAISAAQEFIVTVALDGDDPGHDTLTIAVSAGDPPGAPTNVAAIAGPGQATVSWTAPLASGTTSITGYTATAEEDTGKSCTWTSGDLECTVEELENGTSYTFTVTASNSVGTGPASSPSAEVTPATTPGAPVNVTVEQLSGAGGTATATVSWQPPEDDGGLPITGSFAFGEPSGACFAPAGDTSCTAANLQYETEYTFRAYANNNAGAGDTSAPSEGLTPVNILPGSFAIHADGNPFTFVLSQEALAGTEAFTMSISDIWGRTVWSRTVHPAREDNRNEISWNGRNTSGQAVSAGVYIVRVATLSGKDAVNFVRSAIKQ